MKKQLKDYDQKELLTLVCELSKNSSEAATYLTLKFSKESQEILTDEYIDKIDRCFYSSKLRLKDAHNLVKEFCKLSQMEDQNALIRLEYVERMCELIVCYGLFDERIMKQTVDVFEDFIFKSEPETLDRLTQRVHKLMDMVSNLDLLYDMMLDSYCDYYSFEE